MFPHVAFDRDNGFFNKTCGICLRAKQTRDCFQLSTNKTTRVFEMIHCEVWGTYITPSSSGARYFLTIIDDFSRGIWLYLMKKKSEVAQHLRQFIAMVEQQFDVSIKTIQIDNGTKFMCLRQYFHSHGIT